MIKHDPRDILAWLWDHNLIEACNVYDHRSRWRDAYHGSTHKARIAKDGYYYCVDEPASPKTGPVPESSLVLTCGYPAREAFAADPGLIEQMRDAVSAISVAAVPGTDDTYVIAFA